MQKQERKLEEETILTYAYAHFKNLVKQVIVHHFVVNRGLKRTGHSIISHVVTLKNEIQKLLSCTAQGAHSGQFSSLTEAAIVSGSEEQSFKCGSSSHKALVLAL